MKIIGKTELSPTEKTAIFHLWNNEYPHQLAFSAETDLDIYLNNLQNPCHYFAINENGQIMGWAFVFERDAEKWFAIIIDSLAQRKGVGTALLQKLKEKESILNGWVTDHYNYTKRNGEIYLSPLAFYLKNDFVLCEGTRLEIEKLSAAKIKWTAAY